MDELIDKLYKEHYLNKKETVFLLTHLNIRDKEQLFQYARQTRERFYGNKIYMRGLIEFSNVCRQNCKYCGLRSSNRKVARYRMTKQEILSCCQKGYDLGYRTFVLQSGEDPWYSIERMIDIVAEIKGSFPDTALTLSIGERSREDYQALFQAGADRYLLRHETASERLYKQLHIGMEFNNRRRCLKDLKEIGYQIGAGFMVGLPGQTAEDLAEDLHYLKSIQPHMIGIGPFIPHSETPLANAIGGTVEETLVMLALTRLFVPDCLLPATTALGTLHEQGRELGIKAGANVVMPNLTPVGEKAKYALYENKICIGDEAEHCRFCIEGRIQSTGCTVDMGRGDSFRVEVR